MFRTGPVDSQPAVTWWHAVPWGYSSTCCSSGKAGPDLMMLKTNGEDQKDGPTPWSTIAVEISTMFNGKIHYFYLFLWSCSIAILNLNLPESKSDQNWRCEPPETNGWGLSSDICTTKVNQTKMKPPDTIHILEMNMILQTGPFPS